ncbi:MmcQ/YjbR family DNA-binding protein [Sphingomonas sp. BIUV-7]|uniref:MmcQ/YjbR family DNA-binding protein n=1 Tax=Sphingomonas natans TaxID=3063330 RepID=A0ABT8Y8L4_9SPHN|nr:MmcQ/YjbR family DNA-binding protein [Sphingomonas sp. BIUV-7]MDO6414663.1 MmcQ/YjbR family DNA-binding protein [Sphingomonas sp. BIUV-7]
MSPDPAGDLEKLRAIALALPRAVEKISHGQPIFSIEKGKVFAQYWHDHHRDNETAVMVKTSGPDEQAMLIEADPDLYYRPAYIGHSGWIAIRTDQPGSDWGHIADRVAASWRLVAPAKLVGMGPE